MLRTAPPSGASPDAPASPAARRHRPASWTDRRLLLGALLVVGSLVGVVAVVAASDDSVGVWAVRVGLAPGMTVDASDVELQQVRLPATDAYLTEGQSPVGSVVVRQVSAGELLPAGAVVAADAAPDRRLVTVPVERHHLPADLARGEQVDVYLVTRDATGGAVGDPVLVLASATVDDVEGEGSRFSGSSLETGVVLAVDADQVADVVAASARGSVVLVRVPES